MSRLPLLELDDIVEEYHPLFTDEYLGNRHIFRAWAHNPAVPIRMTVGYFSGTRITSHLRQLCL